MKTIEELWMDIILERFNLYKHLLTSKDITNILLDTVFKK